MMKSKLLIWGTIFGILSVIIFPLMYVIFSFWWLLSGDMVTRLAYFGTSSITALTITLLVLIFTIRKKTSYRGTVDKINELKKYIGN